MSNSTILSAITSIAGCTIAKPGSEEYDQSNNSYFSAFEKELKPSYIARPSSVEGVQSLIKALGPHVTSGEVQIAVRGGGHTPFAGSANIDGGVTIDLRALNGVALSGDKSTVTISAGETWTSVYQQLEKHGLTVPGGRVGRIGVSGFLLGGGLSMFSGETGFACDSVNEFEVVLASGELVRASAEERSDLWIALKGGLNNFGVVTSFKVKTIKSDGIWGGVAYYMPGTFTEVLQRACDFVHNETDNKTHIMCSAGYGFGHQAVTCVMYHTGGIENPPSLQRFTSIEPQISQMNTMRTGKHLDFCEELSKFSTDGIRYVPDMFFFRCTALLTMNRQYWTSITVKPDIAMMETFHGKWQEALVKIKDAEGFIFSFGFHPLTKALLENSAKAGGNAMNIPPTDGPLFVILINPIWTLAKDDDRIFKTVGALVDDLRSIASEKGLLHRYIFTNYGFQADDIVSGYGEESVSKLRETSKKYDPEGMFQKGVPGGFKLPN
ncbi:hypothetical protein KJ359_010594 [Pestalotiopsis sp. 9143b]|nr:hypothetical protein KJ359_010594 [Pestalotiopsis sp. 9143b]